MTSAELDELYQTVLLEHSRRPRNAGRLPDGPGVVQAEGSNPSCGDEVHLSVKFAEDGSIAEIACDCQGCAISRASGSIMTARVKGQALEEVESVARRFSTMLCAPEAPEPDPSLGEMMVLQGVRKFPQRVKCAMLAWRALESALRQRSTQGAAS